MKKYLSIVVALMVTLFALSSFAFSPPAKPANGWYVLDQAGKLTSDQVAQLNQKIETLNKTTKNEYAVVILNSLDGGNIEDVAQSTFVSWGVGKKGLDNGVMLLISVGDRKMRIHTGKGAEGDLPDIYCKEILDKTLRPYLKRGQFYDGVNATIDAMSGHMESQTKETPTTTEAPVASSGHSGGCSIVGTVVGGFAVLSIIALLGVFFVVRFLTRKAKQAALAMKAILDEEEPVTQPRPTQRSVSLPVVSAPIPVPVAVPIVRRTVPTPAIHPAPVRFAPRPSNQTLGLGTAAVAGLGAAAVVGVSALALAEAEHERKRKREREEEEDRARRRRDEEDEDRRRSSYSSSSSSSDSTPSFDWGSSGGGGFGGGDSGGGGASSDF